MMASSNWKLFRVTGPLCGEITDHPHKDKCRRTAMFSLICAWTNGWINNQDAGDLRHYCAQYDIILMVYRKEGNETSRCNTNSTSKINPTRNKLNIDKRTRIAYLFLISVLWINRSKCTKYWNAVLISLSNGALYCFYRNKSNGN